MKKLFFTLATLSVFLFSCSYSGPTSGFVLANDISLMKETNGQLAWQSTLNVGDPLTIEGPTQKFGTGDASRLYDKVRTSAGTEGWAQDNLVAKGVALAVVKVAQALIYTAPQDIKVTALSLPLGSIVAVYTDKTPAPFLRFMAYDSARNRVDTNQYLNSDMLSQNGDDIQAAITLAVLKDTKSQAAKKAILLSTTSSIHSSIFGDQLQAELNKVAPVATPVATAASGQYVATADTTVYDKPDVMSGTSIATVTKGTTVSIKEQSSESFTINGTTAHWLHLVQPDGWAFGGTFTAQ